MKHAGKWVLGLGLAGVAALALAVRRDRPAGEIESRRARAPSKFININGLRTHYRDQGNGPTLVLLHGSNASLHTWEGWTNVLSRQYRVITMDLPGQGLTGPDARNRYSPLDEVAWLDAFVEALGLKHFTLGGNSMGGGLAWRYAVLHPERVDRLILVDAFGLRRDEKIPFSLRLYETPVLNRVVRWVTPRFMVKRTVQGTYGDPERVTEEQVDLYEDMLLREGNREATRQRFTQKDADPSLEQRLSEIKVPTLILWGSRDEWILPKYAQQFHARIPQSRLVMLDGLGHVPMEEDPAGTVGVVQDFLQRTTADVGACLSSQAQPRSPG
ncbi:alpha/beta fold hydrolase [Myxococcus landrumensis]|uniref:Alpha/beta hydrolase n=1 Tax=Myxococcus landrumensis TaxID=2813577 RepID=A0ABX7N824_9BACT|nr:alpha/beta hydrolase [Myxococcus landrumus]QSQ14574.1 alpha/beta hydrolase [Myxococcus landrumus]